MNDEPEIRELLNAVPHMEPKAKAKASKLAKIMAQMVMAKMAAPDEPKKDENE